MEKNNQSNVPPKWIQTDLDSCINILDGKRIPINSGEREKRKGNIPYYGATGQVGWIDDYLFDEEIVLLGEDGAPFFENFENKAYLVTGKSWVNNHAHVLKGLSDILLNKFLCYYLNQIDYHGYVNGTTRLKLNQSAMKQIPISLPPLNEQQRIISKIDELFSLIESTKETLFKIKVELKQYRQSILKEAFQGKITEVWREKHKSELEHAIELLKQIKKYRSEKNAKYKEYSPEIKPHDILPDNWCWTTIGTLFEVKPGSTPSRQKAEYWNGTIPWVSSGEVSNCNIDSTHEKITRLGLENSSTKIHPLDTVLLAMIGEGKTRGKTAILKIPATTNQNVAAILCANSSILSEYVFWWLVKQYDETRRIRSGGMQYALNTERVKMLSIPLCSHIEQEEIVRELEYRVSLIDSISRYIENYLFDLIRLQKTILKKAFSGKLVPQDPNDEPASVLLEKIKVEK